ncbi:AAA family ATPase [Campylobacter fetus]|uniref:AAA family ATPase n=1 Tax=Campylobacter fetus TaxID=196 RepID=UPI00042158E8|nr:AAA family ATPase [Campylobacter fetus]OCS19628.1 hypothetical protein CFVI03596_09290 [Campylobacter fetus subsp. venerealis cfvi03/596]
MPKRNTVETVSSGLFIDESVTVLCEETVRLELGSVAVLSGQSEVGKSFLALKCCANAINEGFKPFFWSIEDKNKAILERINNIAEFYPFEVNNLEFSNERPEKTDNPIKALENELEELSDCDLVIIDTFSAFFSYFSFGDQNNQNDVQSFFNVLANMAKKNNQAILLLHHLDKKGEQLIGSSVIMNSPRLVYKLAFQKGEDRTTTTYRILDVLKDSNNINCGDYQKVIKILENSDIDEPLIKQVEAENLDEKTLALINKKDLSVIDVDTLSDGYVTMNENRGVFYLSSRNFSNSVFYKKFKENGNQVEFKMMNTNGSSYAINLKNSLLTQTHRSVLDALFLYMKQNIDSSVIKKYQDNLWDMEVRLEPYKFLKQYLNKSPSNYSWLKEKLSEISRFAYDLEYVQLIDGQEQRMTQRDKGILMFDSVERIQKENGNFISVFVLTVRREYIKRLHTESTLAYDDFLSEILINMNSLAVQDLIRFLTSFPDKKILTFKEFCDIKAYKFYKDNSIISKQKKEFIKFKDELIEFGINVYGKGVFMAEYDDKVLFEKYKDENDLVFIYQSNNKIKRFIKKTDPMNKLNIKANKYLSNSLFV